MRSSPSLTVLYCHCPHRPNLTLTHLVCAGTRVLLHQTPFRVKIGRKYGLVRVMRHLPTWLALAANHVRPDLGRSQRSRQVHADEGHRRRKPRRVPHSPHHRVRGVRDHRREGRSGCFYPTTGSSWWLFSIIHTLQYYRPISLCWSTSWRTPRWDTAALSYHAMPLTHT